MDTKNLGPEKLFHLFPFQTWPFPVPMLNFREVIFVKGILFNPTFIIHWEHIPSKGEKMNFLFHWWDMYSFLWRLSFFKESTFQFDPFWSRDLRESIYNFICLGSVYAFYTIPISLEKTRFQTFSQPSPPWSPDGIPTGTTHAHHGFPWDVAGIFTDPWKPIKSQLHLCQVNGIHVKVNITIHLYTSDININTFMQHFGKYYVSPTDPILSMVSSSSIPSLRCFFHLCHWKEAGSPLINARLFQVMKLMSHSSKFGMKETTHKRNGVKTPLGGPLRWCSKVASSSFLFASLVDKEEISIPKPKTPSKIKGNGLILFVFSKRKARIPHGKKLKANIIERKIIFLHIHQGSLIYSFFFGGNQNFANANICKFWVLRDFTSNSALFGLMSYFMTPVYDLLFADSPLTSLLCYLAAMLTPDVARSFWRPAHAIQCVGFWLQDNKNTTVIGKMLVPLACLTPTRSPLKGDIPYQINTHYIRCIRGWLLRVPSQGYHHFPYETETMKRNKHNVWFNGRRNVIMRWCCWGTVWRVTYMKSPPTKKNIFEL